MRRGGFREVDIVFQLSTAAALDSQLYNLEQLDIRSTAASDVDVMLRVLVMDPPMLSDRRIGFTLGNLTGLGRGITPTDQRGLRGLWFGTPAQIGTSGLVAIQMVNQDTHTLHVSAQGYIWGARSVMADGGPQRPPSSLYP